MLGRDAELALFDVALADVSEHRRGALIRLVGDPGVGKTRLLREVRERAAGLTVLATACDEYESRTPYLPVRRLLRSLLGIGEQTSGEAAEERLVARVAANAPELIPWLALLGIVLGIPIPDSPETAGLEERFRKGRLEEVTAAFLHEALPSPALIVVEDVHFIDDASADLLGGILGDLADRPWLIVTSDRIDEVRLRSAARAPERVLALEGLSGEDALALVHLQTEESPLPPQAAQVLVERSGGNPLFLRELIGVATNTGSVEQLPDTVEGLVTADIDRLPPALRTVLRYAAVLGMTIDEDLLRRMVTNPPLRPGPVALRPLSAFMAPAGPGRLRFRHALIRAAAYDGLPYRRRKALHDMVGTLLMESLPDPEATPEPLALHFHHAGRAGEAWHFARLAAARARAQYAHAEAADYLSWAVESGRRAQASPDELAETLEALGDVRFLLGLPQEAAATYRQALRDARGDPLRQAGLLLKEAKAEQRLGNFTQSLRRLTRGMSLLRDSDDSGAVSMHSQLATRYGFGRHRAGRDAQALRWGEEAVALGERSGDPLALADAHNLLQLVTLYSAEATDADHGQIALDLYRQVGDLPSQGHALNNLGLRALLEGRWDEALEKLREAAEIFQAVGDAASRGNTVYNQADVLIRQGRTDEADPLLREALRIARGVDDEELVALVLRESGKSAARAGRFDESLALLADATQRLTELGEPPEVAEADAAVAEAYLLHGDWAEALARADAVLERAAAIGATVLVPTLLRIRGLALMGAARGEEARAAFAEGLLTGSSPGTQHEHAYLLAGQAELALLERDPAAERLAAESGAMLAGLGVVRPPLPDLPVAPAG
jgi:tetratricopeptide (TPR) repeat protein